MVQTLVDQLKAHYEHALVKMAECDGDPQKPREIWMYWSGFKDGISAAMAAEGLPAPRDPREWRVERPALAATDEQTITNAPKL